MDYENLINGLFKGKSAHLGIAGNIYDTAWLASIPSESDASAPAFPESLQWLIKSQQSDGSWGAKVHFEPDQIISTLTVLGTLGLFQKAVKNQQVISSGVRYLWQKGHLLTSDNLETIAGELLLAPLVRRAEKAGVRVPPFLAELYEKQRAEKLAKIPPDAFYHPASPLSFSLECLGDEVNEKKLAGLLLSNGSIHVSPAATAFFYLKTKNKLALKYLQTLVNESANGLTVPSVAPIDRFETLWSAYSLILAGISVNELIDPIESQEIRKEITQGGACYSPATILPLKDADSTAIALFIMLKMGFNVDAAHCLKPFETEEGYFKTLPFERVPSLSVNIHVLHAILNDSAYPDQKVVVRKLVDYLLDQQCYGLYWQDKWHLSPYYVTSRILCIFSELPPDLLEKVKPVMQRSKEWLRETQNLDGSWGFRGIKNGEETAYCVIALIKMAAGRKNLTVDDANRCKLAVDYLKKILEEVQRTGIEDYPELWISKSLYTPTVVVRATILSAILAFEKSF